MYKICVEQIAIPNEIPLSAIFARFAQHPFASLLDSGNTPHLNAKYDIMVANPIAQLVSKNSEAQDIDLFSLAQKRTAALFADHDIPETKLPFLVGALGYASYDCARQLEDLPEENPAEYDAPEFTVGIYSWSVIKEKDTGLFFLCYSDKYPHPAKDEFTILDNTGHTPSPFSLNTPWSSSVTRSEYEQDIAKIHDYLTAGDCYQINYAQRFQARYQGDEWQAFLKLQQVNQSPFSAFMRFEQHSIISCSPERFIQSHDGIVETKPIKGTMPRSNDKRTDELTKEQLQYSEKDRAENLMIVDLLRNDLSKNCEPHTVKVERLFDIESFAAVHHLVSTIKAKLKSNISALSLLKDAFPGGSITGAPKIRAMEIIEELERHRRHIYCGSIFYFGIRGDLDSNICIRTLLCENNNIFCWAGGGIVIDSEAHKEYQESLDKVHKILPVLAS